MKLLVTENYYEKLGDIDPIMSYEGLEILLSVLQSNRQFSKDLSEKMKTQDYLSVEIKMTFTAQDVRQLAILEQSIDDETLAMYDSFGYKKTEMEYTFEVQPRKELICIKVKHYG
jgi:hypothetical protein